MFFFSGVWDCNTLKFKYWQERGFIKGNSGMMDEWKRRRRAESGNWSGPRGERVTKVSILSINGW